MVAKNRKPVVGILSLQGDFGKHRDKFAELEITARDVRTEQELDELSALVIPGGESTTFTKLLTPEMRAAVVKFAKDRPVWGTCAGMIMLSKYAGDPRVQPFGLMNIEVDRNGFGRQVHSFEAELRVSEEIGDAQTPFHGVFIRAPRLRGVDASLHPLVWLNDEPVCVRQNNLLASSFHPELTDDDRIHRYFLSMIG